MAPLESTRTKIEDVLKDKTPIQQFYSKKTIFLTGATGFFGKIIMEKLLRVTDIEHIYLLIRNKKGKDVYTRIEEIFDDSIFDIVKSENPKFRHKISVIGGDCSLPGLGISNEEKQLLKQNVDIVIHGAATVRFDEKLKIALAINVSGTREIINLCKEMTSLKAVVHVSTAFAHCNYKHIDEHFYKMRLSGENACRLGECLDEKTLDNITPELLRDYPNTYTFTKALAEDIVKSLGKGLPITIFRPGIVINTYREPVEGWIDNMYGPSGIVIGVGTGILRVFNVASANLAHLVPVDLSVNGLLASAWDIANHTYDTPPIYNYVPDPDNAIIWKQYIDAGYTYGTQIPFARSIWFPTITITSYRLVYVFLSFFYHTIPAILMDTGLIVVGKKPKMMNIYKKVNKFCSVMTYFSKNSWTFSNQNVRKLWSKLSKDDQELFMFDTRDVNWRRLFEVSLIGLRTYVVKDDPNTIPEAKRRYDRLKIIHHTMIYALIGLGTFFLYLILSRLYLS